MRAAAEQSAPAISRRAFVWSAVVAAVAMLVGDGLGEWLARRRRQAPAGSEKFEIGGALDLPAGKAMGFELPRGDGSGLLVHTSTGLRAYERSCPHLGCPVLWSEKTGRIECPCHAAAFDVSTGSVIAGPPPRGLTRIELLRDGGRVIAVRS